MGGAARRVTGALVALAALAAPLAFGPAAAATPKGRGLTPARSSASIQHVVVIVQSGHSFDNYFGTRPGVDGIPAGVCEPVSVGSKTCVKPFPISADGVTSGLSSTARSMDRAIDGGKMNGFVTAQPTASAGTAAMGYYDRRDLSYYWGLADHYALFDHFYAGTVGGALPNRLISVAAQDDGISSNALGHPINVPTIFDRLDQAGLGWKYYVQDYRAGAAPTPAEVSQAPVLATPSLTATPAGAARITDTSQYFTDLIAGHLPAVSYVAATVDSERSPQDPAKGEAFVRSLLSAMMQSTAWAHTVVLLTYDEAGGWYDNAVPPTVGGVHLGLRVPALLISPYARAGFVDHAPVDTASIPALVENVFHLEPLTSQDATAGSLLGAVNLRQRPRPVFLGSPLDPATIVTRPAVGVIYVLYLGALVVAGILVALALVRRRRSGWWVRLAPDAGTAT